MTFDIITLGCKVNEYESQYYAGRLEELGLQRDAENPDTIIVNTCTVTNTAAAKSRQKISRARRNHPQAVVAMVGCYAQSVDAKLQEELGIDVLVGASHKKELPELIVQALQNHQRISTVEDISRFDQFEAMPLSAFEEKHRAFLKVEDGCNQFCTYCQIPYVRGRERSLPAEQAVAIGQELAEKGHLEIVLTGIHTGRYQDGSLSLAGLLKELLQALPESVHFRISSIEITEIDDELIELLAHEPRLNPHLHIPIQSGANATLKRMNRPYTVEEFFERVDQIRQAVPHISISTDIMAGFVQESGAEFAETLQNIENSGFSFLHVFPYSKRDGTAAARMSGHLPGPVIRERTHQLLALSEKLREADMKRFETIEVLCEQEKEDGVHGYTAQYHPVLLKKKPEKQRFVTGYDRIENGVYIVEEPEEKG